MPPAKKARPAKKAVTPAHDDASARPRATAKTPEVGGTVEHRYFDFRVAGDHGVPNLSRYGVVLEVVTKDDAGHDLVDEDGKAAPAVRVGWFTEVSDPIRVSDLDW